MNISDEASNRREQHRNPNGRFSTQNGSNALAGASLDRPVVTRSWSIANLDGNLNTDYAADIIVDDAYAYRLISAQTDGVNRIVMRTRDGHEVARMTSPKGDRYSRDKVHDFVKRTVDPPPPGQYSLRTNMNNHTFEVTTPDDDTVIVKGDLPQETSGDDEDIFDAVTSFVSNDTDGSTYSESDNSMHWNVTAE